ncbi:MAG: hypothetical protein ABJH00_09540 [Cyclobacteriaceae bacterium]
MKLLDILLFTLAIAFFVIGIYESMVLGIAQAYSIFMVSIVLLFIYGYRKNKKGKS